MFCEFDAKVHLDAQNKYQCENLGSSNCFKIMATRIALKSWKLELLQNHGSPNCFKIMEARIASKS